MLNALNSFSRKTISELGLHNPTNVSEDVRAIDVKHVPNFQGGEAITLLDRPARLTFTHVGEDVWKIDFVVVTETFDEDIDAPRVVKEERGPAECLATKIDLTLRELMGLETEVDDQSFERYARRRPGALDN